MLRLKKYVAALTEEERLSLLDLLKKGEVKARMLTRARILLVSADGKTDLADALKVNPQTVRNIRKRFAEEGLEATLQERPRPGTQPKLDGKQEAFLMSLACSEPLGGTGALNDATPGESAGGTADRGIHLRRNGAAGVKKTTSSLGRRSSGALDGSQRTASGEWKMCLTCMPNLTTRSDR